MSKPAVAVIGASTDRRKYGNKAVRAFVAQGHTVYPVNPQGGEVEGLPCYPSIAEVPDPVDWVSMYVPPPVGLGLLDQIAARRPQVVFLNPGTESEAILARAAELGLPVRLACSILAVGVSPASL